MKNKEEIQLKIDYAMSNVTKISNVFTTAAQR
jgi:hypothetical protein